MEKLFGKVLLAGGLAAAGGCAQTSSEPMMAGEAAARSATVAAEEASLIPREALLGNPTKSQGRISPDGQWVSWLAPRDGVMNVWVAPAANPDQARPITNDQERGLSFHGWAPDSSYVFYLQDEGGNENFHLYAADVQTGETRDLTPLKEGARVLSFETSKDRPGVALVGINERNPQLTDLYEVDYRTGERTLVLENPGYASFVSDQQLRPRLAQQQVPGGGFNIYRLNEDGSQGELFMNIPADDQLQTYPLGMNRAGDTLYILDSRGRDKAVLKAVDFDSKAERILATNEEADISDVLFHPETNEPLAYAANYLKSDWTAIDPQIAPEIEWLESRIDGQLGLAAATDDNRKWVIVDDAAQAPGTYYVYDRDARELTEMFVTRPELADAPLQPMHPVVIEARDGLPMVSYLTLPPGSDADGDGRPDEALPTLLWVHGGPWARDAYGYDTIHQWMANRGYAVLSVNYRGSTGFGKDHIQKAVGEFAGKMHDDLIDAVDWAVAEGIAQPDKVAIGGGSYGGYATLVGVTFTPDKFACGVDIVGPSNLITLIESFPEYWKPFLEGSWFRYVGDPSDPDVRKDLEARSPLMRADQIRVPLLIGQGGNDPRVTKIESDQLVEAMQAKGLPVTYINYPDEGHGFQEPGNRLSFFAAMEGFLGQCLGGRVEPIGDDFEDSSAEVIAGSEYVEGLGQVTGGGQ